MPTLPGCATFFSAFSTPCRNSLNSRTHEIRVLLVGSRRCRRWRRWRRWGAGSGRRVGIPGVAKVLPLSVLLARHRQELAGLDDRALDGSGVGSGLPAHVARDADIGLGIEVEDH